MRKLIAVCISLLFVPVAFSQEIKCNITVNTEQVTGGSVQLSGVESFERQVREFVNNRRWTTDKFKPNEQIEFNMLINFREALGNDVYKAEIQIQSVRPVYMSDYNTAVFSFKDNDVQFQFSQMSVLDFSIQNASQDNLTALLAWYIYMVIGYDYDTYSPSGGTKYFQIAKNIVDQNQNSGFPGWKSFEKTDNRYWVTENLLTPRFENIRKCMYTYHREGLDQMYANVEQGRKGITKALQYLEKVYLDVPNLVNVQLFFNAKTSEIISIYKEATPIEKKEIVELLDKIYPSNTTRWATIKR